MKCFAFLFLVNVVPYAPITHVPISKAYILSKCIKIVEILKLVLKNCSASGYFYLFLFFLLQYCLQKGLFISKLQRFLSYILSEKEK